MLLYCSLVYFVGTTDVMDRVFNVVAYLKTKLTMTSLIWIKNSKSIENSSLNFIFKSNEKLDAYSCLEKGCLTIGEKLTRQCRKLWVI